VKGIMSKNFLSTLDVAGATDIGKKRQKNEDSFRLYLPPLGGAQEAQGALFIVADGMGGLGGGDIASQFAIDEFTRRYYGTMTAEKEVGARFQIALEAANVRVREQAPRLGLPRIGSTAAGIVLEASGRAMIFNVGDCRVYRIRNGKIERVSKDQSITQQQVESGMITEEDAKVARSSMVTAFIGQPYPLIANTTFEQVQEGDVYLICSDGLWSLVDTPLLLNAIRSNSAAVAIPKLIKMALDRGGVDNITGIVVRIGKAPARAGLLLPAGVVGLLAAGGLAAFSLMSPRVAAQATPVPSDLPTPTITVSASPTEGLDLTATFTANTLNAGGGTADTETPTITLTPTQTETETITVTATEPLHTATQRLSRTPFPTITASYTKTPSPTRTPSNTPTNTFTFTPTFTRTPSNTPTFTPTFTPSNTATFTPSNTSTPSNTPTATSTDTPTRTPTRRPATRTRTPSPSTSEPSLTFPTQSSGGGSGGPSNPPPLPTSGNPGNK
jgi:serine/threonine protein phosphatase PrpC